MPNLETKAQLLTALRERLPGWRIWADYQPNRGWSSTANYQSPMGLSTRQVWNVDSAQEAFDVMTRSREVIPTNAEIDAAVGDSV